MDKRRKTPTNGLNGSDDWTPEPYHQPNTSMASYIPTKNSQFRMWLLNFSELLTAAPTIYGLSTSDALTVASVATEYALADTIAENPATRTSPTIANRDVKRATAEIVVRPLAVTISLNSGVSNEDKLAIGVTIRSTTPTPIPAPTVAPTIELITATPLVQQLQIRQPGSTSKSKPPGCIAIEVARSIGTVAATDPAQLAIVGQFGKTPLLQSFSAEDQGKKVTYAARYRTRSGPGGVSQSGPWSALASYIVL